MASKNRKCGTPTPARSKPAPSLPHAPTGIVPLLHGGWFRLYRDLALLPPRLARQVAALGARYPDAGSDDQAALDAFDDLAAALLHSWSYPDPLPRTGAELRASESALPYSSSMPSADRPVAEAIRYAAGVVAAHARDGKPLPRPRPVLPARAATAGTGEPATRIIVPTVGGPLPETVAALNAHAPGWQQVPVDGPFGYFKLLAEEWDRPGDLVIVEHDIVIHAEALPAFDDCPRPLCGNPYWATQDTFWVAFGCVRFAAALKATVPDLFRDLDTEPQTDWIIDRRKWWCLDGFVFEALERHGVTKHYHEPEVGHLRPVKTSAEFTRRLAV